MISEAKKLAREMRGFYKNYSVTVDEQAGRGLLELAVDKLPVQYIPAPLVEAMRIKGGVNMYSGNLFTNSLVSDSTKLFSFLNTYHRKDVKRIQRDPAYRLAMSVSEIQMNLISELGKLNIEMNRLQRKYMFDLMVLDSANSIYPDGNSSLRITYGRVEGTVPADGIYYDFETTTNGLLEKEAKGNEEYTLPLGFKNLLMEKDFGSYASDGILPVAFLASAHTTGGNSGSPVLNKRGELVGVNFDRMWEGVLSDYLYDEQYCRNISVDIRYILYIVEKYGKATRLIDEMEIVKNR